VSTLDIVVVTVAIGVGSLLQGAAGFGANLLAVPVLVLVDPGLVPGPALVSALVLNLLIAHRESGVAHIGDTAWAQGGRVLGTVAGVLTLAVVASEDTVVLDQGRTRAAVLSLTVVSATAVLADWAPRR